MVKFQSSERGCTECLIDSGYKAENEEKDKLNQLISDTIGMLTWNISAQLSLAKNNDEVLLEVIRKETNAWILSC